MEELTTKEYLIENITQYLDAAGQLTKQSEIELQEKTEDELNQIQKSLGI